MTDKVQKIREEVEKLHGNPYYMMAVKDVLEILDLQEEPVSIWHDASKIYPLAVREIIVLRDNKIYYGKYIGGFHRYVRAEIQLTDDMAQTYAIIDYLTGKDKWIYVEDLLKLSNVQRTVKNWKEPVSETFEVKDVDLDKEIQNAMPSKYCWSGGGEAVYSKQQMCDFAKHFFELGMRVNYPITAADRGTAEEIIISLKQVEKDYRINHTKEIEWLRNKVQKGELYEQGRKNVREMPQENTEGWVYDSVVINLPDVQNPLYQCFFMKEKATGKRWVYSRSRTDVNSKWGNWKKYLYDD